MKSFVASFLLLLLAGACKAQYFYKDQLVSRQAGEQWKLYKQNKVRSVTLTSIERDGEPSEGFAVDQEVSSDFSQITTHTHSLGSPESWLMAWYSPSGVQTRTLDTSDTYQSSTEYQYDASGRISLITNTSTETDNQLKAVEQHVWAYDASGQPNTMLKIKNGADTTFVRFVKDAKGHVAEEHAERNHSPLPTVYYYYDSTGRLTDIVRFNEKLQRLLPDFMFEYGDNNTLQSTIIVQEGGTNYQKWVYEYNDRGLKTKESCYDKKRQMLGTVMYKYKS
jgi:YD repeat-containing protein